jgi:hypothetical protein
MAALVPDELASVAKKTFTNVIYGKQNLTGAGRDFIAAPRVRMRASSINRAEL